MDTQPKDKYNVNFDFKKIAFFLPFNFPFLGNPNRIRIYQKVENFQL